MSRETSPYIYGDFWLDKRRDGRTPDTWQITTYDAQRRAVVYRSTRRTDLEAAKAAIHAHVVMQRAKGRQAVDEAEVAPLLKLFWEERGRNVISPDQIASSIRQFWAFLVQDEIGAGATVAELTPVVFERFRQWRMAPHSYAIPWAGKMYEHKSKGVNGESVQRNLDDIRAALLHHERNGRITGVRVPNVEARYRSSPRDRVLTPAEIVAIVWYARQNQGLYRFVALMLATAVRPEAAMAFDPVTQYAAGVLDLHPVGWARTKKVNPTVPAIPELEPILNVWRGEAFAGATVLSRKTAWRTMRRVLGLPADVHPKTIRHSIATWLGYHPDVRPEHIEMLLGHRPFKRTTAVYSKLDARNLDPIKPALSTIWAWVHHGADQYGAVHLLTTAERGKPVQMIEEDAKC